MSETTQKTGVWVAGYNMPGYLPEVEPVAFETFEDAKAYMIDELDRHGDYSFDVGDSMRESDPEMAETLLAKADELSAEMEDMNLVVDRDAIQSKEGWNTVVGNTAYWIVWSADQTLADFDMED